MGAIEIISIPLSPATSLLMRKFKGIYLEGIYKIKLK